MTRGAAEDNLLGDVRVLVVDDQKLFAEAVALFLEQVGMKVVGIARDGREALDAVVRERPTIVLVDLNLPGEDGLTVGARILERDPEVKLLAVTGLSDRAAVRAALEAGFHGYLTKDAKVSQFVDSIRSVLQGQVSVPFELSFKPADADAQDAALLADQLTARERETLALLAEGASSREIAHRLSVSPNTVRTHVHNVLTKLGVHSRLEAAAFAVRHGLIQASRSRYG